MQGGVSNYITDKDRPVADSLAVVELSDELAKYLTTDEAHPRAVDFSVTKYNFTTKSWEVQYLPEISVDIVTQKQIEIARQLTKVNNKLKIIDLPEALKNKLIEYKSTLEAINITPTNAITTIVPLLPELGD